MITVIQIVIGDHDHFNSFDPFLIFMVISAMFIIMTVLIITIIIITNRFCYNYLDHYNSVYPCINLDHYKDLDHYNNLDRHNNVLGPAY